MAKTILVVDDEPDNVSTLKTVLAKNGYRVITATSGDDCLKKLSQKKADLVLLDIMMPGTPVREIVPKINGAKVAYVSAVRVSEAEREEMLKSKNIVDFIQKPYDISDMLSRVRRIIGK